METLNTLFESFETGLRSTKAVKPKEYLKSIGLSYNDLRIGFNSGQFHHREPQEVKDQFEALGVIKKSLTAGVNKEDLIAYTVFGRYGIIFPLMDNKNEIVNFFAVRFDIENQKEEYLNGESIYPKYPNNNTKKLCITPTLMDCARLLQSKVLENREAVTRCGNQFLASSVHQLYRRTSLKSA